MKIWEAIIYGIIGGLTEVLPVSFAGHAALLRGAFNLSSLNEGSGLYVRAAICLGVAVAVLLAFRTETLAVGKALLSLPEKKRRRRNTPMRRGVFLGIIAFLPMLLSFLFTAFAERIERLSFAALFFALNGLLIYFCTRGIGGRKDEKNVTLPDMLLLGVSRMVCVFPGLSPIAASLSVGRVCGLSGEFNLRLCYQLTLAYQLAAFLYRLIRAFAYGSFSGMVLVSMLAAMLLAAVFGYLAIQYLRYLLHKEKFNLFSYYCWDAVAIALIVALINA